MPSPPLQQKAHSNPQKNLNGFYNCSIIIIIASKQLRFSLALLRFNFNPHTNP